jgi:hypothetical protein
MWALWSVSHTMYAICAIVMVMRYLSFYGIWILETIPRDLAATRCHCLVEVYVDVIAEKCVHQCVVVRGGGLLWK